MVKIGRKFYVPFVLRKTVMCSKGKVKCALVQAMRLRTGRTAHRRSRGIALVFHDHGTRRGWGVSVTPRPLLTPGKDPVPIVQEPGWAPGAVWTGAENPPPTGFRSPDRPARSQSLYRLSYPAMKACGMRVYMTSLGLNLETRGKYVLSLTLQPFYSQRKSSQYPLDRRMSGMQNPKVKDDLSVVQFNTTFRFCAIFLSCAW